MKNFLKNIFAPSVDSLTASLQRTVKNLEGLTARKCAEADDLGMAIEALAQKRSDAAREAFKAAAAAQKIGALLN